MLHLRVLLQKPTALRRQAVAEAWVGDQNLKSNFRLKGVTIGVSD